MTTTIVGIGDAGCIYARQLKTIRGTASYRTIALNTFAQIAPLDDADDYFVLDGAAGTNGDPMIGRQIAEANKDLFFDMLDGASRLIIVAGMGGGLGTGAAHVVAYVGRELGLPTVAVVSTPFRFESAKRTRIAKLGIRALEKFADEVIWVDSDWVESLVQSRTFSDINGYFATMQHYMIGQVRSQINARGV